MKNKIILSKRISVSYLSFNGAIFFWGHIENTLIIRK